MFFPQLGFGFWVFRVGLNGIHLADFVTAASTKVNALGAPFGIDGILVVAVDKDCLDFTFAYTCTTRNAIACDSKSHTTSLFMRVVTQTVVRIVEPLQSAMLVLLSSGG